MHIIWETVLSGRSILREISSHAWLHESSCVGRSQSRSTTKRQLSEHSQWDTVMSGRYVWTVMFLSQFISNTVYIIWHVYMHYSIRHKNTKNNVRYLISIHTSTNSRYKTINRKKQTVTKESMTAYSFPCQLFCSTIPVHRIPVYIIYTLPNTQCAPFIHTHLFL